MEVDWQGMFRPDTPLLEIFIRGSIVYLSVFLLLRLILTRLAGGIGLQNLLVIVLVADAAQNAMAGEYRSVTDGLVLVGTIVFWSFALDWLGYQVPAIRRFLYPEPIMLVQHGRINERNVARELMTHAELESQLRQQGVEDVKKVKRARLEPDGRVSVIEEHEQQNGGEEHPGRSGGG
jgi:uncharacterized membrane protein YcaP (DUF421 family)